MGPISDQVRFIMKGIGLKIKDPEVGDVWQLGGILVIQPDGRITYQFISQAVGDYPLSRDETIVARAGAPSK